MSSNMPEKINTWRGLKFQGFLRILLTDLFNSKLMFKSFLKSEKLSQCNFLEIDLFYTMSLQEKMKELRDLVDKVLLRSEIFSEFEAQDKSEIEYILLNRLEGKPEISRLVNEVLSQNKINNNRGKTDKRSLRQEIEMIKIQNQRIQEEKNKIDEELRLIKQQLANKVNLL